MLEDFSSRRKTIEAAFVTYMLLKKARRGDPAGHSTSVSFSQLHLILLFVKKKQHFVSVTMVRDARA
jgi:hypothetical protein